MACRRILSHSRRQVLLGHSCPARPLISDLGGMHFHQKRFQREFIRQPWLNQSDIPDSHHVLSARLTETDDTGRLLQIKIPGKGHRTISRVWLRDSCNCEECVDPQTQQRCIDINNLGDTAIQETRSSSAGLHVHWALGDHQSFYSWQWLRSNGPGGDDVRSTLAGCSERPWIHVDPAQPDQFPAVSFEDIMGSMEGVAKWTRKIYIYGFALVKDCPSTPEATKSLLERISFIQNTHYGGFWDFQSAEKPVDSAYTKQALAAHTDTTYLSEPMGLQMFHLLSHTGTGGESIFVDGYAAARELKNVSPLHYNVLAQQPVPCHASGNDEVGDLDNRLHNANGFPVFEGNTSGYIEQADGDTLLNPPMRIRWNNYDRSLHKWPTNNALELWYEAARLWSKLLKLREFEIKTRLLPGKPIIFDNWRYLHGRTAYTGERRICGGYIGMDYFMARLRKTNFRPMGNREPVAYLKTELERLRWVAQDSG